MSSLISRGGRRLLPVFSGFAFPSLREDFDELLNRFGSDAETASDAGTLSAALDIAETEQGYEVRVDVPGMESKDIDIRVHGNAVTISGKREEQKEEQGKTYHCVERRSGSFARSFTLPTAVNANEVVAEYVNGVLHLKLPKSEESKPKKIAVK